MDAQIIIDLARYMHILVVAIGFGTAFLTDMHILSRMGMLVDQSFISAIRTYHATIWVSVIAMWISGLLLIYIRTGFDPANFTPKLFSKLMTVALLTVNAKIISHYVMPMIEDTRDQSIMWLPLPNKIWLAAIGAISTASWMLALAMGSSKVLAASGWLTFMICLPVVYVGAVGLAVGVICLLHLGGQIERQRSAPQPLILAASDRLRAA